MKPSKEGQVQYLKKAIAYSVSLLGALGSGLQSYMAVAALFKTLVQGTFILTKLSSGLLHALAIAMGGVCNGLINLCINIDLLEGFLERITNKPRPKHLKGWRWFQYWFGSGVFIITGILFGLTAFAFGPMGPLTAISIAAGIFIAIIMMIQELETWLSSFDNEKDQKKSLATIFKEWRSSLSPGKCLGIGIAIGNVIALSLLFTLGLATFMLGIGIPIIPALIVSFIVAFTGGAFTEFYFYNWFLSDFCAKLRANLAKFWQAKFSPLGLVMSAINGVVNGALSYVGIMMLMHLLVTAGVVMPPASILIGIVAAIAAFAGLASFSLGMDFWQRNSERLVAIFSPPQDKGANYYPLNDKEIITEELSAILKSGDTHQSLGVKGVISGLTYSPSLVGLSYRVKPETPTFGENKTPGLFCTQGI